MSPHSQLPFFFGGAGGTARRVLGVGVLVGGGVGVEDTADWDLPNEALGGTVAGTVPSSADRGR